MTLKQFDPSKIKDDAVVVIIGKRRTGKSWITRDILYHKRHIPVGLAMSGTEEGNHFYSDYIPDSFVYNRYDPDALKAVMVRQRKLISQQSQCPNAFLVLDDLAYDNTLFRGLTPLREIFMNGRHWKILTLLTLQYMMTMPPDLRQNVDYVFVLKDNVLKNLRKLHENFFGVIDDFHTFADIMKQVTNNYHALVLDNTSDSNDISKTLFWFKAKPRTFKMGAEAFWKQHNKRYNPKHMHEATSLGKPSVIVQKTK